MKIIKFILPIFCLLPTLFAKPVAAFTLQEAWEAAKQHSADFQAAYYQRDASLEQQQQAKAALLPHISANATYQRQPPSISSTRETQGWNVQLSQTLFDASKIAQYYQSRDHSQAAEQRFQAAHDDLLLKVAESYFNLLLNQETIASYRAEKKTYEQQTKQALALFKRGAATAVDVHEAQAGYDNALAQEIAALAQKQVLENQINDYTGLDSQNISPIKTSNIITHYQPKLKQRSLEQWQSLALQHNPEYKMQLAITQSSEKALTATKASRLPTIAANIGYQNNLYTSSAQNSDYRYRGKGMTASVQLSMPLYTGGELRSKIREASAQYEAIHAQLIATEHKIKLAVRQAYTESNAAHYQIMAQERVLKSSKLKLKSTQIGQQYGIRNQLEVIQAQQAVSQAEQKLAEARYKFLMAYLTLVKESGMSVENEWGSE